MAKILLPLDDSLLARIDKVRGSQPRVSWMRDALEAKLGSSLLSSPMQPVKVPREALRGGRVTPKAPLPEPHEAAPAPPEIAQLRTKLSSLKPVTPKRHRAGCTCLVCASA